MAIITEQISGTTITVGIDSSNLKSATYETEVKTLSVTFKNGSIYEYYDVPWEVFTKLRMAKSQGKFMNEHVNKAFKYKKVT